MQTFRAAQAAHHGSWHRLHDVPRRLYHYTTLKGVVGITSSSAMWASDARFLNDASEFEYASKLVDHVVATVVSEVSDESFRALLPTRPGVANWLEYRARPFIACFCEEGDLLSQWRGYGRGDGPAALGFGFSPASSESSFPHRTYLRRVLYEEIEQKRLVADVVRTWVETAQTLLGSSCTDHKKLFPYPAIWALQEALVEHHICFKDPAFSEEREWRLIKLINVSEELALLEDQRSNAKPTAVNQRSRQLGIELQKTPPFPRRDAEGVEIRFRESSRGLVPYVELPLVDPTGFFGRLPLREVIQGPTTHPDLALESLAAYLRCQGYGFFTEVRTSRVPLRP